LRSIKSKRLYRVIGLTERRHVQSQVARFNKVVDNKDDFKTYNNVTERCLIMTQVPFLLSMSFALNGVL